MNQLPILITGLGNSAKVAAGKNSCKSFFFFPRDRCNFEELRTACIPSRIFPPQHSSPHLLSFCCCSCWMKWPLWCSLSSLATSSGRPPTILICSSLRKRTVLTWNLCELRALWGGLPILGGLEQGAWAPGWVGSSLGKWGQSIPCQEAGSNLIG